MRRFQRCRRPRAAIRAMRYIVNLSGGLTSYEALRRCVARHGTRRTIAVFADTRIEDADLYRFLSDGAARLGVELIRLADGRTPFDVWHDERAITLPNGAVPCSNLLKRDMLRGWIAGQVRPYTLVFGMDWSEPHRMDRLRERYAPTPCWFPLAEKPYLMKDDIAAQCVRDGLPPPRLYGEGFSHNNCGGGCVKAGQAQWAHLLAVRPETYAMWEAEEERFRAFIGKDVSILRDRTGGVARPLTLRAFRERVQCGGSYDRAAWGGCGCFVNEQLAMEI